MMQIKRAAVFVIVLGALAAWITTAATSGVRDVRPIAAPAPAAIDASGAELAAEIARLRDRLRPTDSPRFGRDLFQFASARPQAPAPSAAVAQESVPPPPSPRPSPMLTLIGIAEDGATRTAIISAPEQLYLAKEGDELLAGGTRYRIRHISADAAELAATDETILRLALK
jgi:hypothetical protein